MNLTASRTIALALLLVLFLCTLHGQNPSSTTGAELRAGGDLPSADPFRVRYWGVGNESWGCGGNFTPEEYAGGRAVRTIFSAPEVQYTRVDKPAEFWGLSGSASVKDKQLTLTVTNPHLSEPRETEIAVRGARAGRVQAQVLSMPDVHAHNTFENPTAVQPRTDQVAVAGGVISYRFPPASVTRLQIAYD